MKKTRFLNVITLVCVIICTLFCSMISASAVDTSDTEYHEIHFYVTDPFDPTNEDLHTHVGWVPRTHGQNMDSFLYEHKGFIEAVGQHRVSPYPAFSFKYWGDSAYESYWTNTMEESAAGGIVEDMNFYTIWEGEECTITFDDMGMLAEPIEPYIMTAGSKLPWLPNPSVPGYVILGWYQDKNFRVPFTCETTTIVEDITLYAKWKKVTTTSSDVVGSNKLKSPEVFTRPNTAGKPVISWNEVDGAAKYEVYKSENGKDYTKLITTTKTTVTHTGAKTGILYRYQVRAVDSRGKFGYYGGPAYMSVVEPLPSPAQTVKLNTSGKPVISWTALDGAAKYEVYKSENGGAYTKLITTTKNTVTHTGAKAGTTYSYKVRAVSYSGVYGKYSAVDTITVRQALTVPQRTVKLNTSGKPTISWNTVNGAAKYEVYRSINGGDYARLILTVKNTVTHTGATAGNTYTYKVRAVDAGGKYSDYSEVLTVTLKAEEKLSAPTASVKLNTSGKPVISWGAVDGATKYEVYRSVNGGAYARLILTVKNTVTHTGATAGNTYSYKVRAVSASGNYSEYSDVLTVTLAEEKLAVPAATVKLNESGKPVISWNAVDGAEKYEVYRSVNGGAYARLILTVKNAITHTGATAGNTYAYKVRAVSASGNYSEYSDVLTISLKAEDTLTAPTASVTLNASGKPVISWGAVDGAEKYEVYRSVNGGDYARLILTVKNTITHTGATAGNTYTYKVRAVTSDTVYGPYSTIMEITVN